MIISESMPTWYSCQPGLPEWIDSDDQSRNELRKLGYQAAIKQAWVDGQSRKMYLVSDTMGNPIVLKCYSSKLLERLRYQEKIHNFLLSCDVATISYKILHVDNSAEKVWVSSNYLQGRRLKANVQDCRYIGQSLARLHIAFKQWHDETWIAEQSACRLDTFKKMVLKKEFQQKVFNQILPDVHGREAYAKDLFSLFEHEDKQVIHGDVNLGNLLISDKTCYFMDLEDTLHSFLPVIEDLALVIQRLILISNNTNLQKEHLIAQLLQSYQHAGGKYAYHENDEFYLQAMNLRSLCILIFLHVEKNISSPEVEWKKFYRLFKNALQFKDVLKYVLQGKI